MFQALGSTTKTKISYVMFGGCCVLIVGAFFAARMERVVYDESYAFCATVYYSPKTGYRVEYWGRRNDFERISTGCARTCYKDQKTSNGLAFLEIETQSGYTDHHQAFCAGILEGSMTWMQIYAQWLNTVHSYCEKTDENRKFCAWLRDIVNTNYHNVLTLAKDNSMTDHYHHQIFLFYQQLAGIETGFKKGVKRARQDYEIPFVDFILLNSRVDIEDLKIYYNEYVIRDDDHDQIKINPRVGKMILKVLFNEGGQPGVLFGQTADGHYSSMIKIVKTYRFNYHHGPEAVSRLVTNTDITFTSYPGMIASSDDFYLARGKHSRVMIAGVPLKHRQSARLLHGIDLEGTVFLSARVMAANRLSHNGKLWSRFMARDPDIGAKQWLVIDEKRLKYFSTDSLEDNEVVTSSTTSDEGLTIDTNEIPTDLLLSADLVKQPMSNKNLIWLIDQTWRRLHAEDLTKRFKDSPEAEAWLFDGTPFFKVIQELNGLHANPAKITSKSDNLESIIRLLKQKAYRGDLVEKKNYGNIDLKVYSSKEKELTVQNGPITSHTSQPPFSWSAAVDSTDDRHEEHPESWNFPPVRVQFMWN